MRKAVRLNNLLTQYPQPAIMTYGNDLLLHTHICLTFVFEGERDRKQTQSSSVVCSETCFLMSIAASVTMAKA